MTIDVAVIGLGAAGAAALNALARRGARCIGLDRFAPPHAEGSSHGHTRLLRVAHGEGPLAGLMRRGVPLWRALERRTGADLFRNTGVTFAGPPGASFVAATLAECEAHGVAVGPAEPGPLDIPLEWTAFVDREAGFLFAERAIAAMLAEAQAYGADVRTGAAVEALESSPRGVTLRTASDVFKARTVVVAAGGWSADLLPQLAPVLAIERRVLYWFADPSGVHAGPAFGPFMIEDETGRALYGFPDLEGRGVKVAEHADSVCGAKHPREIDRHGVEDDFAAFEPFARRFLPRLGTRTASAVCFYPMSRDGMFVIDRLPDAPVVVAAGLCGHGFKFAPVIGEAVADLALFGHAPDDVATFNLGRFSE